MRFRTASMKGGWRYRVVWTGRPHGPTTTDESHEGMMPRALLRAPPLCVPTRVSAVAVSGAIVLRDRTEHGRDLSRPSVTSQALV